MPASELAPEGTVARPPPGRAGLVGWLPLLPLGGLLLFFAPLRALSLLFAYSEGERQLVSALELFFVALALCDRRLGSPSRLSPRLRFVVGAWIASTALATILAAHPMAALIRQTEWYVHAAFAWVLWSWLRADPRRSVWLAVALPTGLVVYAIQLTVFALRLEDPDSHPWAVAMPAFGNIRHFGYYAASVLPFAVALQVGTARRSLRRLSLLAMLTLFWSLLFWSGGRGALAAIAGSLVLVSVRATLPGGGDARRAAWRGAVAGALSTAILGAGLSTLLPDREEKLGLDHIVRVKSPARDATTAISSAFSRIDRGRLDMWERAKPVLVSYPWLGIGPDGFSFLPVPRATQPHNIVVQALLDWGFLGASCFALLLVSALGLAWSRAGPNTNTPAEGPEIAVRLGALGSLLATVLYSFVDGTLYNAFPSMLAACSLAIATQPLSERKSAAGSRVAAFSVAVALAAVVLGYWLVRLSLWPAESPAPDSARARIVRALPFQIEPVEPDGGLGVFGWAVEWWETDRALALDWLHWGHRHAHRPWHYYHMEARLSWIAGDPDRTRTHVQSALQHAVTREQQLSSHALLRALNER